MALERIGVGAIFTFNEKPGVKNMNKAHVALKKFMGSMKKSKTTIGGISTTTDKASKSVGKLGGKFTAFGSMALRAGQRVGLAFRFLKLGPQAIVKSFQQMFTSLKQGFAQISGGMRSLTIGLAPAGIALGLGVKTAADFEHRMGGVAAITRANESDMKLMRQEAERMGIVSMFSATQAGEGMEFLARAGAKPKEVISALSGVMNAAAADQIDMGTSADIVARVVKGMGLEWGEAAHVADVLALASVSANTNITSLGESFIYGAAMGRGLGIDLEEITALFAKMSDAGLKGTIAGTSFGNMAIKMSKVTEKGQKIMDKYNLSYTKADGTMKKISTIVQEVTNAFSGIKDVTKKSAMVVELFGLRGLKAFNALSASGKRATDDLERNLRKSSDGVGVATEIAEKRLDNLKGQLILFKSSVQGLFIKVFGPLLQPFSGLVKDVRTGLNNVLMLFEALNDAEKKGSFVETRAEAILKFGSMTVAIAEGFRDAVAGFRKGYEIFTAKLKDAGKWFERYFGPDGARKLIRLGSIILTVVGAISPLVAGFMMAGFALEGIVAIAMGLGTILTGAFFPLVAIGGFLLWMWETNKKEGESFENSAMRIWGAIKEKVVAAYEFGIKPFIAGIMESKEEIVGMGEMVAVLVRDILDIFGIAVFANGELTGEMNFDWKSVAKTVVSVVTNIIRSVVYITRILLAAFKTIAFPLKVIIQLVSNIVKGFQEMFAGNIMKGFGRIAVALIDTILSPIRWVLKAVVELGQLLFGEMPKKLKQFADEGFSGAFGKVGAGVAKDKKFKEIMSRRTNLKTGKVGLGLSSAEYGRDTGQESFLEKHIKQNAPGALEGRGGLLDIPLESVGAEALNANAERAAKQEQRMADAAEELKKAAEALGKDIKLDIDNKMCVDGESLNVASAKHKTEIKERTGAKDTPWNKRLSLEHGVTTT